MPLSFKILFVLFLSLAATPELLAKRRAKIENREIPINNTQSSLKSLFNSLDPYSVSQHLAFYELYPKSPEGRTALKHAWDLLSGENCEIVLPTLDIQPIISLVNRTNEENAPILNEEQLTVIEKLSRHLGNRRRHLSSEASRRNHR